MVPPSEWSFELGVRRLPKKGGQFRYCVRDQLTMLRVARCEKQACIQKMVGSVVSGTYKYYLGAGNGAVLYCMYTIQLIVEFWASQGVPPISVNNTDSLFTFFLKGDHPSSHPEVALLRLPNPRAEEYTKSTNHRGEGLQYRYLSRVCPVRG